MTCFTFYELQKTPILMGLVFFIDKLHTKSAIFSNVKLKVLVLRAPLYRNLLKGLSGKSVNEARIFSCCHFDPIRGLLFLVTKLLLSMRKEKAFQSSAGLVLWTAAPLYYVNWIIMEGNNDNLWCFTHHRIILTRSNWFCNNPLNPFLCLWSQSSTCCT